MPGIGVGMLRGMPRIIDLANLPTFTAVALDRDLGHIPGPVIIPNACRVRINWTLDNGKVAHNILYAQWTGTPALSPTLADSVKTQLTTGATWTALAGQLSPVVALSSVTLTDCRAAVGTDQTSISAPSPGTGTGNPLPAEVAGVITLKTANRGPSGRGRIYVTGFPAAASVGTAGVMSAALVTALTNWATTNLMAGIQSAIGQLVLGLPARAAYTSAITGRAFPARAATTVPVTSALSRDNHWDSQRRRGLK